MKFTSTYKLAILAALLAGCGGGGSGGADIKLAAELPPDPALAYVGTWESKCASGMYINSVTLTPGPTRGTLVQSLTTDWFELNTECKGQRTTRISTTATETMTLTGTTTATVRSWERDDVKTSVKFDTVSLSFPSFKLVMEGLGVERVLRSGVYEQCNTGPGKIYMMATFCIPEQINAGIDNNYGMYFDRDNLHIVHMTAETAPEYRTPYLLQRKR